MIEVSNAYSTDIDVDSLMKSTKLMLNQQYFLALGRRKSEFNNPLKSDNKYLVLATGSNKHKIIVYLLPK